MTKCKVCNSESKKVHSGKVLNKYNINYYQCTNCGFVQSENPYWLEEAYSSAISLSDTGIMSRNIMFSKLTTVIFSILLNRNASFLDFGGGYGILTRLMRDKGFNFYWYDQYAKNLVARGFEGKTIEKKYEAITSFENFEHFENPIEEIEKIFNITDFVLFSTDLISIPAPSTKKWWYYCLEHGQHVSFFSIKTLQYIAKKYHYNLTSNGTNIHIFSKKKVTSKIFLITKIIARISLDKFFTQSSKIDSDMNEMIDKMKDL